MLQTEVARALGVWQGQWEGWRRELSQHSCPLVCHHIPNNNKCILWVRLHATALKLGTLAAHYGATHMLKFGSHNTCPCSVAHGLSR